MSIDETGVSLWELIFPIMGKIFAKVWYLGGFLSDEGGLAEAVLHVDGVELALAGAEETSQLCRHVSALWWALATGKAWDPLQ